MSRKHMIEAEAAGVQDTPARCEVGRDGRDENLNAAFISVLVANGLNWLNRQMSEVRELEILNELPLRFVRNLSSTRFVSPEPIT